MKRNIKINPLWHKRLFQVLSCSDATERHKMREAVNWSAIAKRQLKLYKIKIIQR